MTRIRIVTPDQFGPASLEALLEAVQGIEHPRIGLPTGNTPIAFYAALRAEVDAGTVDISDWRPVAIDEYGGARDHRCSNRAFFGQHWDTIAGAPAVLQFDPSQPQFGIWQMERDFAHNGPLDVSVLGIGLNGHLAFNEPGSQFASSIRRVELHSQSRRSASAGWGEETPAWGLTLGLRELLGARSVLVLANGAAKAAIVARAINGPETPDFPASFVRRARKAVWVLDEAAAESLTAPG